MITKSILVGNVHEIGLRKSSGGNIQIMVKISNQNKKDDIYKYSG